MKRKPGTGTVQLHNGAWRLRLPRSLDPQRSWLEEVFPKDQEAVAHAFMDACILAARARRDDNYRHEGLTLERAWPNYVSLVCRTAARRHNGSASTKTRSRLEGMGNRWLAKSPFWSSDITLLRGDEVQRWLEDLQLNAESHKGRPVSDGWVDAIASNLRGVFRMLKLPCPVFRIDVDHRKVESALNLQRQYRWFQEILTDPLDRVMAGCQMGAGLRIWELLSLQRDNVVLSGDPHLMITTGGRDGAPTKGRQHRRVELVEPGLGFFRLAVQHHYRPNPKGLLFSGPQDGYLSSWPEKFVEWSEKISDHITTHDMRHTWAFSMLSGIWGYPPQDITFVSRQLGHKDIRTTQRAYGHWDPGAGVVVARFLRGERDAISEPVTAAQLLGLEKPSGPGRSPRRSPLSSTNADFSAVWVDDGKLPEPNNSSLNLKEVDYRVVHETARALVEAVLEDQPAFDEAKAFLRQVADRPDTLRALLLVVDGDPRGVRRALDIAAEVLASAAQQPTNSERVHK